MTQARFLIPALSGILAALAASAHAADEAPANAQVIEPQVERRDVNVPRIRANDIELGGFAGSYSAENFGANSVRGLRLGYHITEDFFLETAVAQTSITDQAFRQILPSGIFPKEKEKLRYYDVSLGYNLFPGEVFVGKNYAMVSGVYLIGGAGSTQFIGERHQTFNAGLGIRLLLTDWAALRVDFRDHVFSLDVLGTRKTTQNFELTGGVSFLF